MLHSTYLLNTYDIELTRPKFRTDPAVPIYRLDFSDPAGVRNGSKSGSGSDLNASFHVPTQYLSYGIAPADVPDRSGRIRTVSIFAPFEHLSFMTLRVHTSLAWGLQGPMTRKLENIAKS